MNKTNTEQLLFTVGLARKAGKLSVGTDTVCDDIRKKKIFLVLYASDVSQNTEKHISDCASFHQVPCHKAEVTKEALGGAIGKAFAAAVGITDENMAKLISGKL